MSLSTWQFEAVDTLFFKESRPMESVGAAQLASQFPPPVRTLIGAIRTAIGDSLGGDWVGYKQACLAAQSHPIRDAIGSPASLNPLSFVGPYLLQGEQRLFPAPLVVLKGEASMVRLQPGEVVESDLGKVRLPQMSKPLDGAKPLEGAFVTSAGLQAILAGDVPELEQIRWMDGDADGQNALFHYEERLGIARDNARRVTGDGLLYQTRHIRPAEGLAVALDVNGAPNAEQSGFIRLGAEGRMAHYSAKKSGTLPDVPKVPTGAQGLLVTLLTPAMFSEGWLPDGLTPALHDGTHIWQGEFHSVGIRLVCAVTGKPLREGGWDMVNHMPRDLVCLVPAGSCYFLELAEGTDLAAAAQQLHGKQIGQEQEYGRGQIAVGFWKR